MVAMLRAQGTPARARGWFGIDFDVADVPRDRFLIAGQAWASCRSGAADPARFGLSLINEAGDWWIAGNEPIDDDLAALLDRLARLTQTPDAAFADLMQLCEDERLRVPEAVHNHLRDRFEVP